MMSYDWTNLPRRGAIDVCVKGNLPVEQPCGTDSRYSRSYDGNALIKWGIHRDLCYIGAGFVSTP